MSTSSEKSLSTSEDKGAQEKSSETRANENEETQKDERRNLLSSRYLAKMIYPSDFKYWPILGLLKPEFTTQIRMFMVYGIYGTRALIVTKDKNVYALNYNEDDCVKIGKIDLHHGIHPERIEELCGKNIKTFACNLYLVLALTEEGEVYSWGFDKKHESDFGSRTAVLPLTPTRVTGLSNKCIVDIACGNDHSLALTSDGKIYAWGENKYGQIGKGAGTGDSQPRQVKHELEGKKIVHIACGSVFNMVVTDKGKLYGWGKNDCGQISVDISFRSRKSLFGSAGATLDIVKPEKYYVYPREITAVSDKTIVKVACGFQHTLALTDEGKIYAWGNNDGGQLGVSCNPEISAPIMVDVPEVLDIAAKVDLSVAVSSNGTVYVWGDFFCQDIRTPFPTEFSRIHYAFAYSINSSAMHKPLTVSTNNDVKEVLNILDTLGTAFDDPVRLLSFFCISFFTFCIIKLDIHMDCRRAILLYKSKENLFTFTELFLIFVVSISKTSFNMIGLIKGQYIGFNSIPDPPAVYTVPKYKFSYIVYKAFLKYLYTGTVDLPSEKVLELMKLADEYCETNLKRECCQIIEQAITTSNVAFFYNKAIEFNAKEFEEFCFQFALCHMRDVILSEEYIQLDISVRNKFIRRAAEANAFRT